MDLSNGRAREITRSHLPPRWQAELTGRGTAAGRDGDDFLYVERHDDLFELRASPPSGPSRLLRAFRGELPGSMAVNGDQVAFEWGPHEGRSLMLTRSAEDEPQALLSFRGYLESVTWSPDGGRLAVTTYRMPTSSKSPGPPELLLLEVDRAGRVTGDPTVLETPDMVWWGPQWLPHGRGLLVVGDDGNIWQISTEAGIEPAAITGDLPDPVWWAGISPDGRFIAYARNIFRGSSIWRVDLGEALAEDER